MPDMPMMAGKHTVPMCRYFRQGKCTRGESCPFSHDLSHPDSFICPYFLEGFCKYGSRCQYDHKQPEVSDETTPSTFQPARSQTSSTFSVDPSPWRPACSSKSSEEVLSSRRPLKLSTTAVPFKVQNRSALHTLGRTVPGQDHERPVCIYFQTGACQFGDSCRFNHVVSDDLQATAAAVAQAEHATRTAINLRDLETLPGNKQKPQVVASLNWSQACSKPASDKVLVAPVKQKAAWGNSLLVNKNPSGFPQTLPEASSPQVHGWKVVDSNVDELDPWERSQNPETIPLRPQANEEAEYSEGFDGYEGGEGFEDMGDPSEMFCTEYTMTGHCSGLEECPCIHGDQCPCCGYFCLHPTDAEMRREHETGCYAMFEEMQRHQVMQTMECGICLEPVLMKDDPSARCFGLLDCDHCFCLNCIRNWRGNTFADIDSATRTCPECRRKSHFVTPCAVWPATEEEKHVIIEDYKQQLQEKHCMHFDYGRGTCPFGTSCFYRHEYLDGSLQDRSKLPDVRFVTNSDGEFTTVRDNTLASLLDTAGTSRLLRGRR